jgi:hypothetical protein
MLERLVHAGTAELPRNQKAIVIHIGARVSRERWRAQDLPDGWADDSNIASRAFGGAWITARRSAVLIVPSSRGEIREQHRHQSDASGFPVDRRIASRTGGLGPAPVHAWRLKYPTNLVSVIPL